MLFAPHEVTADQLADESVPLKRLLPRSEAPPARTEPAETPGRNGRDDARRAGNGATQTTGTAGGRAFGAGEVRGLAGRRSREAAARPRPYVRAGGPGARQGTGERRRTPGSVRAAGGGRRFRRRQRSRSSGCGGRRTARPTGSAARLPTCGSNCSRSVRDASRAVPAARRARRTKPSSAAAPGTRGRAPGPRGAVRRARPRPGGERRRSRFRAGRDGGRARRRHADDDADLTARARSPGSWRTRSARRCWRTLAGRPDFRVEWVWLPSWRPADISEDGREQLRAIGFTRAF